MVSTTHDVVEQFRNWRVLPVIVVSQAAHALPLADALTRGGLPVAEITLRTPAAMEAIRILSAERPDVCVGAGTVLTEKQAGDVIDAGARFIVSPGLNPGVVELCLSRSVPVFPGVVTPTEIENAMRLGLQVVKFFPAEPAGGLRYLQAVCAPYRDISFIPTGGMKRTLMADYLATGRVVACGGSWMAPESWLNAGDFGRVERETTDTMRELSAIARTVPA
ncbi:MAG: bifunctional 4-hydroxy-2-oxoglutarate aldolase/2-dehydro-3-deoxy-phosphogluconate aldolase [Phycisphaerae bacterium]|nr:bifunctional 4-hydroxy-2-oxoglutarate aldolase/2-dehydro-3-deoxy-phosphogluconate aldolase [Gemmatimonadaceae bacterium]